MVLRHIKEDENTCTSGTILDSQNSSLSDESRNRMLPTGDRVLAENERFQYQTSLIFIHT
jgi:hypothetical protein